MESELVLIVLRIDVADVVRGIEVLVLQDSPRLRHEFYSRPRLLTTLNTDPGITPILRLVVIQQHTDFLQRIRRRIVRTRVVVKVVPDQSIKQHQILRIARARRTISRAARIPRKCGRRIHPDNARQQGGKGHNVMTVDRQILDQLVVDQRSQLRDFASIAEPLVSSTVTVWSEPAVNSISSFTF